MGERRRVSGWFSFPRGGREAGTLGAQREVRVRGGSSGLRAAAVFALRARAFRRTGRSRCDVSDGERNATHAQRARHRPASCPPDGFPPGHTRRRADDRGTGRLSVLDAARGQASGFFGQETHAARASGERAAVQEIASEGASPERIPLPGTLDSDGGALALQRRCEVLDGLDTGVIE